MTNLETAPSNARGASTPPSNEPFLRRLANLEDEATGDAFEIYEFSKPLGETGILVVPRDKASEGRKLKEILISKNWDASADPAR